MVKLNQGSISVLQNKMGDKIKTNATQIVYSMYNVVTNFHLMLFKMLSFHTGIPVQYFVLVYFLI